MIRRAGAANAISRFHPWATLLVGLLVLPACGGSDSDSDSQASPEDAARSREPLTPGGGGGIVSSVDEPEVRARLTIDGTTDEGPFRPGGSSLFGGYFRVRFDDIETSETALELGFTDAVTAGTYALATSEVELGVTNEPVVMVRVRHDSAPRPLYVDGTITLDTFELQDPSGPFSLIEGSFQGTLTTGSGSVDVDGEFFQESTCRANPGNIALRC